MIDVHNVITVSNTDVVTMLMVKQKKIFEDKLDALKIESNKIKDEVVELLYEKAIKELFKKIKVDDVINAYQTLLKVLNPKVNFTLGLSYEVIKNQIISSILYSRSENNSKEFKFQFTYLPIKIVGLNSKQLDNFGLISQKKGMLGFEDFTYVTISVDLDVKLKNNHLPRLTEINNELTRIYDLLRNENKLKEQIIAKVTEKALQNTPGIKDMGFDNLLLES